MKKKIALGIVVFMLAGNVAHAVDAGALIISGGAALVFGGVFMGIGSTTEKEGDYTALPPMTTVGVIFLVSGGLDLLIGLIFLAIGEPFLALLQNDNPVLEHVSMDATADSLSIGFKTSY
ncbi:MAG: hypothetical protein LBT01_05005 [Spirochaetaceae bacterium]|jgi:hypothetical protein|nr:hypothetical protein [Spirochaetaceae bacterium]